jgi:hypothetical protein
MADLELVEAIQNVDEAKKDKLIDSLRQREKHNTASKGSLLPTYEIWTLQFLSTYSTYINFRQQTLHFVLPFADPQASRPVSPITASHHVHLFLTHSESYGRHVNKHGLETPVS